MKKLISTIVCLLVSATVSWATPTPTPLPSGYWIKYETHDGNYEHQYHYNAHHFLSVIENLTTHVVDFRPHPGCDANGWGSSLYIGPYTDSYKGPAENGGRITEAVSTSYADRINLVVTGAIYTGSGSPGIGAFTWNTDFTYDPALKHIDAAGSYDITVYTGTPTPLPYDLTVCRLSSNYLCNVYLLDGTIGHTGDMSSVDYQVGDDPPGNWIPNDTAPNFYHWAFVDRMSIQVNGDYYQVACSLQYPTPNPTPAQIAPAYKPSMNLELQAVQTDLDMLFYGQYNTKNPSGTPVGCAPVVNDCICKMYWHDNVGMGPLILQTDSRPEYNFAVTFHSEPIAGDPTCTPTPIPPPPVPANSTLSVLIIILGLTVILVLQKTKP